MPKIKHKIVSEDKPEEVEEEVKENGIIFKEIDWPVVSGNGKFQALPFTTGKVGTSSYQSGFVVYNPMGNRVSGIETDADAKDIVLKQNVAGHYK